MKNIFKHSNGTECNVALEEKNEQISLLINDNGTSNTINKNGLGLTNIQERVKNMNGSIQINNKAGFKITIELPLAG